MEFAVAVGPFWADATPGTASGTVIVNAATAPQRNHEAPPLILGSIITLLLPGADNAYGRLLIGSPSFCLSSSRFFSAIRRSPTGKTTRTPTRKPTRTPTRKPTRTPTRKTRTVTGKTTRT